MTTELDAKKLDASLLPISKAIREMNYVFCNSTKQHTKFYTNIDLTEQQKTIKRLVYGTLKKISEIEEKPDQPDAEVEEEAGQEQQQQITALKSKILYILALSYILATNNEENNYLESLKKAHDFVFQAINLDPNFDMLDANDSEIEPIFLPGSWLHSSFPNSAKMRFQRGFQIEDSQGNNKRTRYPLILGQYMWDQVKIAPPQNNSEQLGYMHFLSGVVYFLEGGIILRKWDSTCAYKNALIAFARAAQRDPANKLFWYAQNFTLKQLHSSIPQGTLKTYKEDVLEVARNKESKAEQKLLPNETNLGKTTNFFPTFNELAQLKDMSPPPPVEIIYLIAEFLSLTQRKQLENFQSSFNKSPYLETVAHLI